MFFTIKPKVVVSILLIISLSLGFTFILYQSSTTNAKSKFNYTIVIDAGHGGRDAGCIGTTTEAKESDLTLSISKKLQKYLYDFGFNVVMTRENFNGLYSENVPNFKKDDLAKREKIIANSKANMLVSIHLNAFTDESQYGAQAFYEPTNTQSVTLSNSIQTQLLNNLPNARKESNKGDYYILKNKSIPCSLVECGFLSNPNEEKLLITDAYQQKVAYAIFCGIIDYLTTNQEVAKLLME